MKIFLLLLGKVRLGRKLSAASNKQSAESCRPSALNRHSPTQYRLPPKTYTRISLLLFILVFVSCSAALAQDVDVHSTPAAQAETEITPLKIGDKIPDELWEMYFPVVSANSDQVQYLSLGDFKDKLIILDFWATWCAPCISSLYKLDTLQQEFSDELIIIPTSYEPQGKVQNYFTEKKWQLPSAFEETTLKKYFPYRSIPHQVWIEGEEVIAITGPEYANRSVIETIISGKKVKMHMKDTVSSDMKKKQELLTDGLLYHSTISKFDPLKTSKVVKKKNGISIQNIDLLRLFKEAYSDYLPFEGFLNRVVFEIPDSIKNRILNDDDIMLTGDYESDKVYYNWLENNTYCYSIWFVNDIDQDQLRKHMARDLNGFFDTYFGINAKIEERKTQCLLLEKLPSRISNREYDEMDQTHEGDIYENLDSFIRGLQYSNPNIETPIINTLGDKPDFQLKITSPLNNILGINEDLRKYGLTLNVKTNVIPQLVFYETRESISLN